MTNVKLLIVLKKKQNNTNFKNIKLYKCYYIEWIRDIL